jgi:hypothetical protein
MQESSSIIHQLPCLKGQRLLDGQVQTQLRSRRPTPMETMAMVRPSGEES